MKKLSSAFKISLIYFTFSFLWILYSDKAVNLLTNDNEYLTQLQTFKGWFFITVTALLLYFLIRYSLKKEQNLKNEYEKILNTTASPIIVFNEDGKILNINRIWEEKTGYKYEEIDTIEKWTQKAYGEKASIMKKNIDSLYSINSIVDNGEFTIKTKDGKTIIWHFHSAPYGIKDGKRTVVATALDITDIKEKEYLLMQQSKMAAMGEILENIAHQWRQPLSAITSTATSLMLQKEIGVLSSKNLNEQLTQINNSAQYLSKTIDDFRSFFKPNQDKNIFLVSKTIDKSLKIWESSFSHNEIKVIKNYKGVSVVNYEAALTQVLMNIFSNSKDALENKEGKRLLFIDINQSKFKTVIKIKDNAEGISEDIISRIFEPYFTTKHESQGTGIGLYMSKEIIQKHMKGSIEVKNCEFEFEEKMYKGAEFIITLPLKID